MNLSELWMGEKVMIKSSGKIGIFEGVNSEGKARIKYDNKIFLVTAQNLEIVPEKEVFPDIYAYLERENKTLEAKAKVLDITFNHTIDLHIEKLAPHMKNELSGRILDYQLEKTRLFIRDAIDRNFPHITIIHGKGQGVLKSEIEHILKDYLQVRFTFSKNGGGAVEVWL
ncbi:MAG: Smr/MutS family protein [Saprospiraceae bacterium]|jgi:dsDNA-specific endonuclease/ATPase MutS2